MKVRCKHCSQKYEIDDSINGRKLLCPICGEKFIAVDINIVDLKTTITKSENKASTTEEVLNDVVESKSKRQVQKFETKEVNLNNPNKTSAINTDKIIKKKTITKPQPLTVNKNFNTDSKTDPIVSHARNEQKNIREQKSPKGNNNSTDFLRHVNIKLLCIVSVIIFIGVFLLFYYFVLSNGNRNNTKENTAVYGKDKVVCNEFKLVTQIDGSNLSLYIDTDLPDDTKIGIIIYRTFKGSDKRQYSLSYYRSDCTAAKLHEAINISLDRDVWDKQYNNFIERMKKNKKNVNISSISDDIIVYAYVGFKQPNMKFGKNNTNLVGSAVEEGKYRIVKSKTKLKCPL
jgi:hypothetical protein